jgi:hypothetical protein
LLFIKLSSEIFERYPRSELNEESTTTFENESEKLLTENKSFQQRKQFWDIFKFFPQGVFILILGERRAIKKLLTFTIKNENDDFNVIPFYLECLWWLLEAILLTGKRGEMKIKISLDERVKCFKTYFALTDNTKNN